MNQRLMRPTAALFPLAIGIAMLSGNENAGSLLCFYYLIQLFSLCAMDAFRNGAAREPGRRKVDKRLGGALLQLALGIALLLGLDHLKWLSPVSDRDAMGLFLAAGCVSIEQMFEERMYALGRRVDGVLLSVIANVLLLTGMLLDAAGGITLPFMIGVRWPFTLGLAALGTMIAVATAYAVEPARGYSIKPVNLAQSPKACVQTLLYPGLLLALSAADQIDFVSGMNGIALLYGIAIWRLCRTVCRRTQDESRPLNLMLCAAVALPLLLKSAQEFGLPITLDFCAFARFAMIAFICAAVVFCASSVRLYSGMILLICAILLDCIAFIPLPEPWNCVAVAVLSLASVILNAHKAFLKKAKRPEYRFGE